MPGSTDAELSEFCQSDSLSKDGLQEIFERHGCTPNHPGIDNYDFFHLACKNKQVTEGILRYLLDYFPDAGSAIHEGDIAPLHLICYKKNVTLGMVKLLIDASPDSLHHSDQFGLRPLHNLCYNSNADDEVKLEILKLLLEKCPESHADSSGRHPIHIAARFQSTIFCRMLIGTYPGSERLTSDDGVLPLHWACAHAHSNTTVEYLYGIYPESINAVSAYGYPIHWAIHGISTRQLGIGERNAPETAVEILRFLLNCDPSVASHRNARGELPLYYACHSRVSSLIPVRMRRANSAASNDTLRFIKLVFDVYPEAIEGPLMTTLRGLPPNIQLFIDSRLSTAQLARDHRFMTTGDEDGRLPLHVAIGDNDCLGAIKLLVNGNPDAVQTPDNSGALPLHIACQYHESDPSVVEYLIGLDPNTLTAVDEEGNTPLHYACRGANYDIIALLLEKYVAPFVSRRNVHDKLPIDFLLESDSVDDRDGIDYTQSVFQLIQSYPETVTHMMATNRI